jgi:RNA polymerase sigma-70 factor (ECF subfamily)
VVERYYQELLNFLSRQIRDRDAAADLVQETYVRVAAAQRDGGPIADARAFPYRTARNLLVDQHRRREVRGDCSAEDEAPLVSIESVAAPPLAFEPD